MNENEKVAVFKTGKEAAYKSILAECQRNLPAVPNDQHRESLETERATTINMLRTACGDFGDNNWEDSQHLADIIKNHLLKHLRANQ